MATFTYEELRKKYQNFSYPKVAIQINGKNISNNKAGIGVSDLDIEVTCGFEASIATFWIYGGYSREATKFQFDELKSFILLGSCVAIGLGYENSIREVFRGFIARVNYSYRVGEVPGVEITAMDVKGIMMAGNYSRQLKSVYFSDAVKEILEQTAYTKLQGSQVITALSISDTPDKGIASSGAAGAVAGGSALSGAAGAVTGGSALSEAAGALTGGSARSGAAGALTGGSALSGAAGAVPGAGAVAGASDNTIEMVCESDYEFVVKAAKKFNYEFFSVGGTVYFRKAKSNTEILLETKPGEGLKGYEVEYDITGQVGTVEVRGVNVSKARLLSASQKLSSRLSQGNKAKGLVSRTKKIYIDPTVSSREDAGYRAAYLAEDISYRLGTLEAEFIGLPELTPGRFITVKGLGTGPSNTFYLTTVRHILDSERGYITRVTGKTAQQMTEAEVGLPGAGALGGLSGTGGAGGLSGIGGSLGGLI